MRADYVSHSCGFLVHVDEWEEHDAECPKGFGGAYPIEAARLPSAIATSIHKQEES